MQFCDILIECLHSKSEGFMFINFHTVIFNVFKQTIKKYSLLVNSIKHIKQLWMDRNSKEIYLAKLKSSKLKKGDTATYTFVAECLNLTLSCLSQNFVPQTTDQWSPSSPCPFSPNALTSWLCEIGDWK